MSSRWLFIEKIFFIFVFIFLNTLTAFAGPSRTTYQAKIVKPDGYPLESSSVNFKFTILDPAGSCILYSETYSSVNMASTGGLISFSLGSGVKTYPASATTFEQVFSNITPSLSCDAGGPGSFSPSANDTRKIVMQFHDGSGWQTLPAMTINAVPYAMYANEAQKLNGKTDADFVQVSTVPTCGVSEALKYNGSSFSCIAVGSGSTPVTSGSVVTALGYTPADGASVTTLTSSVASASATISSVSSTVFSVSSTVTGLTNSVSAITTSLSNLSASMAAIVSSQWITSGTNILYNSGNVAIGGNSTGRRLEVYAASGSTNVMALRTSDYVLGVSGTTMTFQFGNPTGDSYASINTLSGGGLVGNSLVLQAGGNGRVGIGTTTPATRLDVSGGVRIGTEATSCSAALAGTLRYNSGVVEYCNGTTWAAFGVSGAGILAINGLTSGSQTFAMGSAGTQPDVSSTGTVHTFNFPLASAGSVTAGLISNTDYLNFSNKITSSAASVAAVLGYVPASASALSNYLVKANNLSDLTSSATARTNLGLGTLATANSIDLGSVSATGTLAVSRLPSFAGDVTSVSGSNSLTLSNSGVSAGTYTKVIVDAKGRVTSGSQLSLSDVTSALGYSPAASGSFTSSQWTNNGSSIYYNSGTVAIGTATPNTLRKLHIHDATATSTYMKISNASATQGLDIGVNAVGSGVIYHRDYKDLIIGTSDTQRMVVQADGLVGIGVTTPQSELHVNDGGGTTAEIRLSNSATGAGATDGFDIRAQNSDVTLNNFEAGDLLLATNNTERLRIVSGGNIGIGTSTPTTRLELSAGAVPNGSTLTFSGLSQSHNNIIKVKDYLNNSGWILGSAGGAQEYFHIKDNSGTAKFTVDTNSGNAGIGVAAPNARLHLASGTSTMAQLKFTSGILTTSPQSGAVEYDGFNLYYTDGSNTRRMLASTTGGSGTLDNAAVISNTGNISMVPVGSVIVSSTMASTNSQTGSLVVKGGMGISGDIYSSGTIVTSSNITGSEIYATSATITPYIYGSTASGGSLRLESTTNATKGNVILAAGGGNVAVGNITPTSSLHVLGSSTSSLTPWATLEGGGATLDNIALRLYDRGSALNNNNILEFAHGGPGGVAVGTARVRSVNVGTNAANGSSLYLETASDSSGTWNSSQLVLNRNGYVGIGTNAPTYNLHVSGTAGSAFERSGKQIIFNPNYVDVNTHAMISSGRAAASTTMDLRLQAGSDDSSNGVVIKSTGKVGIGTINPTGLLHVARSGGTTIGQTSSQTANAGIIVEGGGTGLLAIDGNEIQQFGDSLFMRGADGISFSAGDPAYGDSVTAMSINRLGKIGFGTATPQVQYHFNKGTTMGSATSLNLANAVVRITEAASTSLNFDGNTIAAEDDLYIGTKSSGSFQFFASDTIKAVIGPSGLGIGLVAPSARLHLASGTTSLVPLKFSSGALTSVAQAGAVEYDGFNLYFTDGSGTRRALAESTAAGDYSTSGTILGASVTATSSVVSPYLYGSTAGSGNLIIDSTTNSTKGNIVLAPNGGSVGVGTSTPSPSFALDVSGVVNSTGYMNDAAVVSTTALKINFRAQDGGSDFGGLGLLNSGANRSDTAIFFGDDNTEALRFVHVRSASPNYALYEYMRIAPDGKVGVGTSSPNYLMDLYGAASPTLRIRSVSNDASNGPTIRLTEDLSENGGYVRYHSIANTMDLGVLESGVEAKAISINRTNANVSVGGVPGNNAKFAIEGAGALGMQIKSTTAGAADTMNIINDMLATGNFWFAKGTSASGTPTNANRLMNITNEGNVEIYGQAVNGTDHSGVLSLKTQAASDGGTRNEVSLEFYSNNSNLNTRTGYVGFESNNNDILSVMPVTGSVLLGANGAEMARVTSAGVGIGTSTPLANLHVNASALIGSNNLTFTTSGNYVFGPSNSLSTTTGTVGNATYTFGSNNSYTSTASLFSWNAVVVGRSNTLTAAGNSSVFGANNTLASAANSMVVGQSSSATTGSTYTFGYQITNSVANSLQIGMTNASKITMLNTGNIGIGTTNPTQIFDVVKTAGDGYIRMKTDEVDSDSGIILQNDARTWKINTKAGYSDALAFEDMNSSIVPMVIKTATGNVGINNTAPTYKLDVSGGARLISANGSTVWTERSDSDFDIQSSGSSTKSRTLSVHGGVSNTDVLNMYANNAGSYIMAIAVKNVTGYVGMGNSAPTERLHISGNLRVQGSTDCTLGTGSGGTNCTSDARLKEHIKPIPYALDKVLSLKGVEFDWNDKSLSYGRHDIGVIAQDVEKVFPTAVVTDKSTGYKKVDYAVLVAPLIQAFKEFNARILKLFDRTEEHSREIASIKEENAELKSRVEKTEQENKELKERLDRIEKALTNSNSK